MLAENTNFQELWEELRREGKQTAKYPYDKIITFVFRNYQRNIPKRQVKILEVGCGAGNNLWALAKEGFDVYGIDGSATAIEMAKQQLDDYGVSGSLYCQDFTQQYPFEDNYFDLVFDRGSLTCVSYSAVYSAIQEIYRVLKKQSLFFFNPYSTEHSSFYTSSENFNSNNTYIDTTQGSLAGTGKVCFYTYDMILNLFPSHLWQVKQVKHLILSDLLDKYNTHAEYEVIVQKL